MANENMMLIEEEFENEDFNKLLEEEFENQLEEEIMDFEFLEKEKMGNPENLGNVIQDIVWEQFINQIGVVAGEDFIKENRGLTLDLSDEAHIQTTENFEKGKIATHNTEINYQERYNDWQSNFKKDENGNIITHKTRSGKEEATLVKGARAPFDKDRPTGSKERKTDMDHTISAAEIIRDSGANAHMTKEEQIAFANSDKNLLEMDSSQNHSKGDSSTSEWLDNPNKKGQKPKEIFNISDEDEKKYRKKDKEAREEYERQKKEAEKKSVEAGKKSQKEEAFRIGGKALRAAVMGLLAELVKEIIKKLVKWFKSNKRELSTLKESFKEAVSSFLGKIKQHLITAGNTASTTIMTAIIGPVFGTLKKIWMMLKQAVKSVKDAILYIRKPENRKKSLSVLLLEVSKIILAGATGIGAIVLSEVIEKGLMTIPVFAVEIPLIGSLANILGIFFGAVVSGIIGAIIINFITKMVSKKHDAEITKKQVEKGNEILSTQNRIIDLQIQGLNRMEQMAGLKIKKMNDDLDEYMKEIDRKFSKKSETKELTKDIKEEKNFLKELATKEKIEKIDNHIENIKNKFSKKSKTEEEFDELFEFLEKN